MMTLLRAGRPHRAVRSPTGLEFPFVRSFTRGASRISGSASHPTIKRLRNATVPQDSPGRRSPPPSRAPPARSPSWCTVFQKPKKSTHAHTPTYTRARTQVARHDAHRAERREGARRAEQLRGESKRMVGAPDTTRSRRAPLRPCPCDVEIGWLADCARIISGVRGRRTRVGAVRPRNVEFDSRPFAPLPTSRLASQAAKNLNARIRILNFFSCWLNEKFLNYLYRPF